MGCAVASCENQNQTYEVLQVKEYGTRETSFATCVECTITLSLVQLPLPRTCVMDVVC